MKRVLYLAALCMAATLVLAPAALAQTDQFDCTDFEFQEDAQDVYNQDARDPSGLDEDDGPDDGIACENLPSRGTGTSTGATGSQYGATEPCPLQLDQFPPGTVCGEGGGYVVPDETTATDYQYTQPVAEAVDEETSSTTTTTPLPDTGGLPLVPLAGASLLVLGLAGLALRRRVS